MERAGTGDDFDSAFSLPLRRPWVGEIHSGHWKSIIEIIEQGGEFLFSSLALLALAPVMLVIAVAIRLDSSGPSLFIEKRLGRKGINFNCLKLRTMFMNSDERLEKYLENNPPAREEWKRYAKLKSFDPRVTRMGRFLRKHSLDELPQLLNVLKGEMRLIGPRPYLPEEMDKMDKYADTILEITPGITGLWQVSGRNELTFEDRLQMDTWYVRNRRLRLNVTLFLKTFWAILDVRGAY